MNESQLRNEIREPVLDSDGDLDLKTHWAYILINVGLRAALSIAFGFIAMSLGQTQMLFFVAMGGSLIWPPGLYAGKKLRKILANIVLVAPSIVLLSMRFIAYFVDIAIGAILGILILMFVVKLPNQLNEYAYKISTYHFYRLLRRLNLGSNSKS